MQDSPNTTPLNKTAFVRSFPDSMPASKVVQAAADQGMKLSLSYVYNIRAVTRRIGGRGAAPSAPAQKTTKPRLSAPRNLAPTGGRTEDNLRQLIAEVGLTRVREVMAEVEAAFL